MAPMARILSADADESAIHHGVRLPSDEAPYYVATGDEVEIFSMCHERGLPVMLKGPTGCGKTRVVEHMAWRLRRPLVTIACHDDLSASDLTGRFLIRGDETGAYKNIIGVLNTCTEAGITNVAFATAR